MSSKVNAPNFDAISPHLCLNAKLRKLHRLLNGVYQQKINPFGLRGSMLSILFIVGKNPDVNQKMLAEMLVLDESTMSRDIGRLVKEGWIEKNQSMEDARVSHLLVTKSGYKLLEKVSPIWQRLHDSVEVILGGHQIAQIDLMTRAIQDHLPALRS